jgi:hypothetical protein
VSTFSLSGIQRRPRVSHRGPRSRLRGFLKHRAWGPRNGRRRRRPRTVGQTVGANVRRLRGFLKRRAWEK